MKVPTTPENKTKCFCGSCLTFTKNSLKVGAFCTLGKSEKTPEMQGCAYTTCPVFGEYTLSEGSSVYTALLSNHSGTTFFQRMGA